MVGRAAPGLIVEPVRDDAVEVVVRASCQSALRELGPRSGIGVERRTHGLERPVEAGLRRAERDAQRVATAGSGRSR